MYCSELQCLVICYWFAHWLLVQELFEKWAEPGTQSRSGLIPGAPVVLVSVLERNIFLSFAFGATGLCFYFHTVLVGGQTSLPKVNGWILNF